MKTLIIHPHDVTTHFLTTIYIGRGWTVINDNISKSKLKEAIKSHDRIVMLGHGTEDGLIGYNRLIIDSRWVYLLREKLCVCIWCNADKFVEKYNLKGFYTGMIISEYEEALMYSVISEGDDINISNKLFAKSIKESIDSDSFLDDVKGKYIGENNNIINFNKHNLYEKYD